jgi:hypothetical protein
MNKHDKLLFVLVTFFTVAAMVMTTLTDREVHQLWKRVAAIEQRMEVRR